MNKYTVVFKYSSDGEHWCHTSRIIEAESDFSAMEMIKSRYPIDEIVCVRKTVQVLFIERSTASRHAFASLVKVASIIKLAQKKPLSVWNCTESGFLFLI